VIDLHLHTTASDGQLAPAALVERLVTCGISTFSVTDHDTTAGLDEARDAAAGRGLTFVPGIEITAIDAARDVHILAYFFDPHHQGLSEFLARQREERLLRVARIGARLAALGYAIDTEALVREAEESGGRSVGRPRIADALIAAGHVRSRDEAFDRFLGANCPAFVPRAGEMPERVIDVIRAARGIPSLAHPIHLRNDDLIPRLAQAGLAALEARHGDHDAAAERHYRELASRYGLVVTGGSDFHNDHDPRGAALGRVTLPSADYERLCALAA
jgi:predicted metal-dependent phosphoesterase TrpH